MRAGSPRSPGRVHRCADPSSPPRVSAEPADRPRMSSASRRGVQYSRAPSYVRPASTSEVGHQLLQVAAALRCMRAGISSERSSMSRSAMTSPFQAKGKTRPGLIKSGRLSSAEGAKKAAYQPPPPPAAAATARRAAGGGEEEDELFGGSGSEAVIEEAMEEEKDDIWLPKRSRRNGRDTRPVRNPPHRQRPN